ncbi:nad dependent epimerase dehydratase [Phlyctema vagabunda]|uniref:Nad dependent epimerase dehydratase n=1 Tax=Phlyctema vagabunda TaxID=108571 RepID=A0ABR4PGW7_9HELO
MRIPGLSITMSVPDYPLQSSLHAPADTSRSIQVIGAGFSRTGTASFTLAVERLLGGPVCHGGSASVLREEGFIKGWVTTTNPELDDEAVKANLKKLLAGYVGVTDNPCAMFVKELVEMYPDAKVICTTRDPESWYRSIQGIVDQANLGWMDVCFSIIPTLRFIGAWRRGMKARRSVIYPESNDIPEGSHFLAHYGKGVCSGAGIVEITRLRTDENLQTCSRYTTAT